MTAAKIADILNEMAILLELSGANRFRVNAYSNGARIIKNLDQPLDELIEAEKLTSVKGIGSGLAETIHDFYKTGTNADYEKLKSEIPDGLLEMVKIPGFGAKKARVVWQERDITTVAELEYACHENRLVDLKGFGQKTQDKILKGIETLKKFAGRFRIHKARAAAHDILEKLREEPSIQRMEVAGSLRRHKETCKDIDILVSATDPEQVMQTFVTLPDVEEVIAHGKTKSSIRLSNGIAADMRIVSNDQFPFALHYFTGSKEHNTQLRSRAKTYDLKLNEYGLFKSDDTTLDCQSEADIFAALELHPIPPELREGRGEIEYAADKAIPELIQQEDIKGMIHCHSTYSDGRHSLEEMAENCRERGYHYLVMCDHSQSAVYANGLKPNRVRAQQDEIEQLNQRWDDFRIFKGIESDILTDGRLDYEEDVLAQFEVIVASVHSNFGLSRDEQTKRVIRAVENPHTTILGHMTGRLLLGRDGFELDIDKVIDACVANGTIIELNANPHRLDVDWRYLSQIFNKGGRIAINPDAHSTNDYDNMQYGIGVARKGWTTASHVINCLDLAEFDDFIKSK